MRTYNTEKQEISAVEYANPGAATTRVIVDNGSPSYDYGAIVDARQTVVDTRNAIVGVTVTH